MAGLLRNIIGNKEQELLEAAKHGKEDVVEKLVYKNLKGRPTTSFVGISWPVRSATNVNCVDSNGYTPLHLAVLHGHKVTVERLLSAEALPSLQDNTGCTTLHLAAWKGYPEICKLVLANEGVPINIQDSNGDTALHYAAQYGYDSVVDVLIQHNADPSFRNLKQESALDLAAQYGHVEVVSLLVEKFPYLSQRLIPNRSPLHLAAACGHRKIVEILLDAGFDINTKTDNGTALHVAVMYFKPEIVSVLLERGTDLMGVDRNGHTAQDIAAQIGGSNSNVSLVIQQYIQKLQDLQKAMAEEEGPSPEEEEEHPSPEEERPSPRPRAQPRNSSPKEDLYSKPSKRDRSQDKKLEEPQNDTGYELVAPPIPPRSQSLLEEITKHLPSFASIVNDTPPAPFSPVPHQPFPIPPKSSPPERLKQMPPRQPSVPATWDDIPVLPPAAAKQRHNSGGDRKPVTRERRTSDGNTPYYNVSQIGGPKRDYMMSHDELPPPRACPGDSSSVHVSVGYLSASGENLSSSLKIPKKTPPQKPKRSKPPASCSPGSRRSPQGQQNRSPVPPRRDSPPLPDHEGPIMDYLPLKKPLDYMTMSDAKKELTEDYMRMSDAKNEPTEDYMKMSDAKKEPMEDYMKMSDAKKEPMEDYMKMTEVKKGPSKDRMKTSETCTEKEPTEDYMNVSDVSKTEDHIAVNRMGYMKMNEVKASEKTDYVRMSDVKEDENDTYKDMYKILNLNRDRVLSSKSNSSHNTETKQDANVSSSSSLSTSSDDLLSSDSGELYINRPSALDEDVFTSNQEHGDKVVHSIVTEKTVLDNIPDIPLPRRPTVKQTKTSKEEPPVLPVKIRSSQRQSSQKDPSSCPGKKRRSRYDNVQCEEAVVPIQTGGKGDDSSCDKSFCDKNKDSVVIEKTLDNIGESRLSEALLPDSKRLSNGVHHVVDQHSIKHLGEGKLAKPPSLEFEKKRLHREEIPLTPTGYPQPATPDFPPPSPNTAMQGIQEKMAGIDSKRSSRDMETITETVYLRDPSEKSSSAVNIPKVDNISGANDIPFADDALSITSSGGDLYVKKAAVDEGLPSGPSGDQADFHASPVVMRRSRNLHANIQPPEGAAEMRRSTGSASSSSQEDLMREDELGPLAAALGTGTSSAVCLLRGSVVGRPRRVVSQIWDNVKHRKYLRAKKRQSLPTTGLIPFDPLMEKEEDLDKKMIDSISATRVSMTTGTETDANHFDDTADWAQIQITLDSVGVGMARESVFVKEYLNTFTEHLTSQGTSKVKCLGDWLEDLNLDQYENTLVPNGYDNIDFLGGKLLEDQDLEHIGIKNSEHRKQILDAARLLPEIKPIDPDNPPATVEEWLKSLSLMTYIDSFKSHNKDSMERVLQLWEVELQTVLDISAIGHRKRILASLGERQAPERQYPSLKKRLDTQPSDSESSSHRFNVNLYKDYTGVKPLTSSEEDVKESSQSAFPPVDSSEDEEVFRSENKGVSIRDDSIHLRPPHQATITSPIKEWRHPPVMLIKGYCNYMAQYLGSTLVKELSGPNSTIEGISKLKKSADVIAKIPTIKLAISFRGVKFIDAKSERVICDHEIGNIFCACQDADSMNFFAYITRDNENHYCHVFSVKDASLAREIILTLGEAFEVAYQMALKEKAQAGALEFDRQMSQSDVEPDSISISSKASISTV
ncbi:ankyrin repeat and sterile alpha motif domain-containing protein 1B-like isoform X3 [Mizuhopecten yessoensis]|uniref:ankyrin repeat and sterile alpha motif domain-containing protein 1B-like isoform X3 n=1 Tax=Mizuhopecten yessoensis TaxID=6573 RepID=UPI000B4572A1|nr:ankyrin repeat and sterile alpha motif domain-containing protein 1B-like isoform X3 [Mizuhopecten yessoensis]